MLNLQPGDWFNAKAIEDAVTMLNEEAGNLGYAFADINPNYDRDAVNHVMNVTFQVGETPRVYVERIDIQGNTATRDKVIRREFRINEGDAFNAPQGQALAGPPAIPRLFPGESGDQADRRVSARPGGARRQRRREIDRRAPSCPRGYSSLERFILSSRSPSGTSWAKDRS